MPVRLGPRAESVQFTHLDGAGEFEPGRPTRSFGRSPIRTPLTMQNQTDPNLTALSRQVYARDCLINYSSLLMRLVLRLALIPVLAARYSHRLAARCDLSLNPTSAEINLISAMTLRTAYERTGRCCLNSAMCCCTRLDSSRVIPLTLSVCSP